MKLIKQILPLAFIICISSCKNKKNIPDVSNIKIDLKLQRFDKDFFTADTNSLSKAFDDLNVKYGSFFGEYLYKILVLQPNIDSALVQAKSFLSDSLYRQVYIDVTKQFSSMNAIEKEINLGLKLTKYYFPQSRIPNKIVTYIGPLDGINIFTNKEGIMEIALLAYMGKDYPVYQLDYIQQAYPFYKIRRFEPNYIATDCIKTIIEATYKDESKGKPLVERMIETGRRLYVLDALLPNTEDSVKTGYTAEQLKSCYKNEDVIWSYFVQHNLLFEREPSLVSPFVTDGPKTPEISELAPGNIGQFTGWQIVKKWMSKNSKTTLQQLMTTPAMTIFNEANYAP